MNIDHFPLFLQRSTLLLSLLAGSLLLAACGGSDGKKSASSSSSSSSQRSSYSAASIPSNGTGDWPSVKIEATNIKTLTISWSGIEGATSYRVYKSTDDTYVEVPTSQGVNNRFTLDMEVGAHVTDWFTTGYQVEPVGCTPSSICTTTPLSYAATEILNAIGYLKASNTDAQDFFGWSIALSGDGQTLAVGAPSEDGNGKRTGGDPDNNSSTNAGAVYVFIKDNNLWRQQAYLKASNTEEQNLNSARFLPNDRFGYRVALSDDGNTLAVSALLEDSPSYGINCIEDNYEITTTFDSSAKSNSSASTPNPYDDLIQAVDNNVGAVYVFKRKDGVWQGGEDDYTYIKPEFPSPGLQFGDSLALSGDGKTLAVGASTDDILGSGVRHYSSSSARECLEFYPSSVSSSSKLSSSSSVSSSSKTSSSSSTSSYKGGTDSGGVYIYIDDTENGNGWKSDVYLKASNAQSGDNFGVSLALSKDGSTIAVGALGEDSNATGADSENDQSVNVCVYADNDEFVQDVGCKKSNIEANSGAVYVFKKTGGSWAQQAYLKPAFAYVFTQFGTSVYLSDNGDTLAVGAVNDATFVGGINQEPEAVDKNYLGAGAVYIFKRINESWTEEAYIKPSTVTAGTQFGLVVSLSGDDGNTLAAGSYLESSAAKGINGDEGDTSMQSAGAIYVFNRNVNNAEWTQRNYVKSKNTDAQDRFGISVDLSDDGQTMAVGAHRESGRGYASLSSQSNSSTSSSNQSSSPAISCENNSSSNSSSANVLNPNDNCLTASGAVYIY